jgi:hypothetical protein
LKLRGLEFDVKLLKKLIIWLKILILTYKRLNISIFNLINR